MWLNILQNTGQPPTTKNYLALLIMLKLSLDLENSLRSKNGGL